MPNYPEPSENPLCQCWPNMMAAMFCPHGHMTECHAGLTCEEAECSHWASENNDEDEYDDYGSDWQYEDEQE